MDSQSHLMLSWSSHDVDWYFDLSYNCSFWRQNQLIPQRLVLNQDLSGSGFLSVRRKRDEAVAVLKVEAADEPVLNRFPVNV